jgi:leucyl/phenylalanyl-tRNA--protein transferase
MSIVELRDYESFPPVEAALDQPNGLLAMGGDLSPQRLLDAYEHGIFPWFDSDLGPLMWWSPDPRAVLFPGDLRVSRSLRKSLRSAHFSVTFDTAFADVLDACAGPRRDANGTWITPMMREAYLALHEQGFAHSVETWRDGKLAGGLYGVSIGRMFFGESMFARVSDASKVALCRLVEFAIDHDFSLIDCQMANDHLSSLGAIDIPRARFVERLAKNHGEASIVGAWTEQP